MEKGNVTCGNEKNATGGKGNATSGKEKKCNRCVLTNIGISS